MDPAEDPLTTRGNKRSWSKHLCTIVAIKNQTKENLIGILEGVERNETVDPIERIRGSCSKLPDQSDVVEPEGGASAQHEGRATVRMTRLVEERQLE